GQGRAHPHGPGRAAGRRGQGAQHPGRHTAGPDRHPAGHQGLGRAQRRTRSDLTAMLGHTTTLPTSSGLAADPNALAALKGAGENKAALKEAAKQFEALFMRELIKSMREATSKSGLFESEG